MKKLTGFTRVLDTGGTGRVWRRRRFLGDRHMLAISRSSTATRCLAISVIGFVIAAFAFLGTALAAPATNLVANPSLELGSGLPDCYSQSGWGTTGIWQDVDGHGGGRAVEVSITGHTAGDRKLLQTENDGCAPVVEVGAKYEAGIWYKSTVPVSMTFFTKTSSGWSYWGDLAIFPASEQWTHATVETPEVPAGTTQLTFGLSLGTDGKLATDDYSLALADGAPTPLPPNGELIANPDLADGQGLPSCFMSAGWGEHNVTRGLSTDVPEDAEAGARSYEVTMDTHVSGDAKLIQAEAAGCAPSVVNGKTYEIEVDYKSTSDQLSLTVFAHTSAGWGYWMDLKNLPESSDWSTVKAQTPETPAGVDRISFGIALFGDGTLKSTGYSLKETVEVVPEPVEPGAPETVGKWQVQQTPMPIRAIHTTLLNDGRLLLIAGSGNDGNNFEAGSFRAVVWSPDTNIFTDVPVPYDMFCAGHVTLPDGKVLLAGGTGAFPEEDSGPNTFKGSDKSYYFDPEDDSFHPLSDMAGAHWYPSLTKLGNGDIWAAGGLDEKAEGTVLTEMFDTSEMRWLSAQEVPQTWSFWGTYPHMFLLEDGRMFYTGGHTFGNGLPGTGASLYDWQSATIWDVPGLREKDLRDQAGSVFIGPVQDQRLMIVGGGNTDGNIPAINLVDIIDLKDPAPSYEPGPSLPGLGKAYVNLTNLPDRTVLASNGAQFNRAGNVFTAAIFDPVANGWTSIDADPVGRNYHSTSILLPDGRVAVLGSNPADNSFEMQISLYSPPYMFKGTRPEIADAPESATYGQVLDIEVTGDVRSASLMAPMSATHQTDTNARLIDLPLSGATGSKTVQIPNNPNIVPPGPYMLTVLDVNGVPSAAKWVWVS